MRGVLLCALIRTWSQTRSPFRVDGDKPRQHKIVSWHATCWLQTSWNQTELELLVFWEKRKNVFPPTPRIVNSFLPTIRTMYEHWCAYLGERVDFHSSLLQNMLNEFPSKCIHQHFSLPKTFKSKMIDFGTVVLLYTFSENQKVLKIVIERPFSQFCFTHDSQYTLTSIWLLLTAPMLLELALGKSVTRILFKTYMTRTYTLKQI